MYLVTSVSYIANEDFIKSVDQQKESVKPTALGLDSPYVVVRLNAHHYILQLMAT